MVQKIRVLMRFRSFAWLLFIVVFTEIALRFFLGLGRPPLYVYDNEFEYAFAPNQDLVRFGNSFKTNSWGMRSSEIDIAGDDVILLVGDSVVNGGVVLNQGETIASRLEQKIQHHLEKKEVKVASVAAGSWGPLNQIYFLEQLPEINVIAIVHIFSSHDDSDIPTFRYSEALQPESDPPVALVEVICKYLPRAISLAQKFAQKDQLGADVYTRKSPGELSKIVSYLSTYQVPTLHYHHLTRSEVLSERPFYACEENMQCKLFEHQSKQAPSLDLFYIDDIHPSSVGADRMALRVMADLAAIL